MFVIFSMNNLLLALLMNFFNSNADPYSTGIQAELHYYGITTK
jgi:hypothetical protein